METSEALILAFYSLHHSDAGQGPAAACFIKRCIDFSVGSLQKKEVQENFITPEAQVNSVQAIKPTSVSAGGRPSASRQLTERRGASNINAHDLLLRAAKLIRGELLKVFGNDAVRAADI